MFRRVRLCEIGSIVAGGTPKTKVEEYWNGSISWITPKDLSSHNNIYIQKGERCITKKGLENSSAKILPKGTVLFTSRAPIGYIAIAENDVATNQGFKSIIVNDKNDNIYIYYLLKNNVQRIENFASGSTFKEISGKVMKDLEFEIPSLREQKAISKILYSIDKKIETNNQINKTLENMAQAIFTNWFVDFEFPNENGEPYKTSGGQMVESELGMIPKGWEVTQISDMCEVGSSKRIFAKEYVDEGIPFYRSKEVIERSKGNDASTELYITREKYLEIKEKFPMPVEGDMLLTSVGTLGVPYLVGDEEFYFKDGNLTWFREYKKSGYRNQIYLWILSKQGKSEIDAITIGSTQKALTITVLKKIKMLSCNDDLLNRLEEITSTLISGIKSRNSENSKLAQLRDTLLPKLMSGEIRVPIEE